MRCGQCGTPVERGFRVCRGCGAHYRRHKERISLGVISLLFTPIFPPAALIGIALIFLGMRKKWFRANA